MSVAAEVVTASVVAGTTAVTGAVATTREERVAMVYPKSSVMCSGLTALTPQASPTS